tara:strand:- start:1076 stop:1690 length:615 start_codon:yes stop_codon:yes gene_type:complete
MQKEQSNFGDAASASLGKHSSTDESFGIQGVYHAICYDKDGNIKWEDTAPNLVTAVGKQALFDYYFGATGTGGGTASGANYMGLCGGTATYAAADTMASHTWTEVGGTNAPAYTGNRQSPTWSAATSTGTTPTNVTTKAASAVTFTFTSGGTVNGCFINGGASASATKDTTTGILYSAGNFTGGSKTVASTDTLAVTYSTTATS